MCDKKQCIALLSQHLPYIQKNYGVKGLCLFGSTARGDNRPDSDIDLLVDMPPKIMMMSALKDYLESLLNTSVDLIRRHSNLSQKFLTQIANDGINIL